MTWLAISHFLRRVASSPLFRYAVGAFAVFLLLYAFHVWSFRLGEASKDAEYQIVIQEERDRLETKKKVAEEDARERIQELEAAIDERDAILEDIRRETDGLDNPGIGRDGVRLLNRIR